ncbi:MAG: sugar porter family MFS transporter [Saprospiraceae bacterium]|nr:sugar porter family MFS transporter [Saprospiraceae bacterium]
MKSKSITYWAITVALAGFLFGFDTIVISGADQPIQKLWNTSPLFHGTFIMSMALWGTVIGALFGGWPCNVLGRKKTLFWIGILYSVSAIGSALAIDPYSFSFFRFIGGIGVGASSVAAPIYISEISPKENRGRLVASYQFNIVFGILIAFLSNYLIGKFIGGTAWRFMLGIEALPALIYTYMVSRVPESPRWLIMKKDNPQEAFDVLEEIYTLKEIPTRIQNIYKSISKHKEEKLFSMKHSWPVMLVIFMALFNQLSGINFVLYYAPRIFEQAGIASDNVLGASIPIGIVNFVFTLLGMYYIDRVGRKKLMVIGSLGYIFSLACVSWSFTINAQGIAVVASVCAFIASHAIGQGAVIWVFISEIFPNTLRDKGMSLGSGTHWVCAAIITLITPYVLDTIPEYQIFAFFSMAMLGQLFFVLFYMPETKGIGLEDLEDKMQDGSLIPT